MINPQVVRPFGRQAPLPLARMQGGRWIHCSDLQAQWLASPASLDVLSDLMTYGMVAPLAQVAPGCVLWSPAHNEPDGATSRLSPREPGPGSASITGLAEQEMEVPPDRWRYSLLSVARMAAARTGLPFSSISMLSIIAQIDALPVGDYQVALPRGEAQAFLTPWRAPLQAAVLSNGRMLRERRRIALGLPATLGAEVIDQIIVDRLVAPMADFYLGQMTEGTGRNVRVVARHAQPPTENHYLPVGRFLLDDPKGENIFWLASRRLAELPSDAHPRRLLRSNPRNLLRRLSALGYPAPRGAAEAVLAALQLGYLHSHRFAVS